MSVVKMIEKPEEDRPGGFAESMCECEHVAHAKATVSVDREAVYTVVVWVDGDAPARTVGNIAGGMEDRGYTVSVVDLTTQNSVRIKARATPE